MKDLSRSGWGTLASRAVAIVGVLIFAVASLSLAAQAQSPDAPARQPTLNIGDAAPTLASGKWIKGEPIQSLEPGKIYVIECWATWCGPCRAQIPHITELQQTYAKDGVTFIGQDVWERDVAAAEPFVKEMGDKMDYRIVLDDGVGVEGKMATTWLAAAGENGIPCSFLVDRQGKIAWIGHPMELEPVLKQVIAGTVDLKKAADERLAGKELTRKVEQAVNSGDTAQAIKLLDQAESQYPGLAGRVTYARFNVLLEAKDYDAAYRAGAKAVDALNDQAEALDAIAWQIAAEPGLAKRDLDLAYKAASRADELTHHKSADVLDTLARVHFEKGDVDKAIEVETRALDNAESPKDKAQVQKTLDGYKQGKSAPTTQG